MNKTAFQARKEQIQETNIQDFAKQKGVDTLEAKLLWEQEMKKPFKGKSPNPNLNLFQM